MENQISNKQKKHRPLLVVIVVFLIIILSFAGYFLFRFLCPTAKELLVMANVNSFEKLQTKEVYESFNADTEISIKTDGDFTSQKAAKMLETFKISLNNSKNIEGSTRYNVNIDFLGNDFFDSEAIKKGDTEVMTVPQLADVVYGADSYADVLSLLFGSEKSQEIGIYEGVDTEKLKELYGVYAKRLYENITDGDISLDNTGNTKNILLKADLNRVLYEILADIEKDTELRDFSYEQKKIIYENINKKIPYIGTLLSIEDKDEYDEKFEENLLDYINDIEDATLIIAAQIDKNREIISESVEISSENERMFYVEYIRDQKMEIISSEDGKDKFLLSIDESKNEHLFNRKTVVAFDINDYTKEKSDQQKMLTVTSNTQTDFSANDEIVLPENFTDIRKISDADKEDITETASAKFMELIATLILKLLD